MTDRLLLIALLAVVALGVGLVVACGDDDDDDNDTTADDDTVALETCEDVYFAMDDCDLVLTDTNGADIPIEDLIVACEGEDPTLGMDGPIAGCIIANVNDCSAMQDCLAEAIG